jgi:hypothetical protein
MTYSIPFPHNKPRDGYSLNFKASTGLFEPQPSALPPLNPKDFGCPWDSIHDDLPGWTAMMNSIPDNYSGVRRIILPAGFGFFSDHIRINKPVHIEGQSGGDWFINGGFYLPPGKNIFVDCAAIGDTIHDASWTKFSHVSFASTLMQWQTDLGSFGEFGIGQGYVTQGFYKSPQRVDATFFEKGTVTARGAVNNTTCFFRATVGGISAGTTPGSTANEPAGFTSTIAGVTFTDGGVTWISEMYPKDYSTTGYNSTGLYRVGDRVFVPGECRYYWEVIQAGAPDPTGATNTSFTFPLYMADSTHANGQDTFSDGFTYTLAGTTASITAASGGLQTLTGLSGMTAQMVGSYLWVTGAANSLNNGVHLISNFISSSSVQISTASGVGTDANNGSIHWTVSQKGAAASITAASAGLQTITGLTNMSAGSVGNYLVISGAATAANNGSYLITNFISSSSVKIANAAGLATDANNGTIGWRESSLVWKTKSHSALVINCNFVKVQDCYAQGFTNAFVYALSTTGSVPAAYSDFTKIEKCIAGYCGMGIFLSGGFDTNGCIVRDFETLQFGIGRTIKDANIGTGGHTVWDKGLRNSIQRCYAQFTNAPAYYTTGASTGTFIDCDSENGTYLDLFLGSNNIIIRQSTIGINPTSTSAMLLDYNGGGLSTQNSAVSPVVNWNPGLSKRVDTPYAEQHWSADNVGYNNLRWEYQGNRAFSFQLPAIAGTGWWGKFHGAYVNRIFLGESQYPAAEGPGHWRDYWGHFNGPITPYYSGIDVNGIRDVQVRGGQRILGDKFKIQGAGNVGVWDEIIVTTAGYQGKLWASNQNVGIDNFGSPVYYGSFGTLNEPTTNIAGTTLSGQSGSLGSIASVSTPLATITGLTGMTPQSVGHILQISGAGINNNGCWLITNYISATSVKIYNPFAIVISNFTWSERLLNGYVLSDGVTVISGPGGKVFKCTTSGTPGVTEPNWSTATTIGNTVTDGSITWTYIGNTPTYAYSNFVEDQKISRLPQTRTLWADGYMTDGYINAPKSASASFRVDGYTSSNTANQTIFNMDNALFTTPLTAGSLVDNAEYHVEVLITCKSPGAHTEAGSSKISGDFYRDGGSLVRIGALDNNLSNFLSGSTCRLNINTNTLDVQVSPGINAPLNWTIIGQVTRKTD